MIFPSYHERPANCCKATSSSPLGGSRCSSPSTTSKKHVWHSASPWQMVGQKMPCPSAAAMTL